MWKDIKGFENKYQVNEKGDIKSLHKQGIRKNGNLMSKSIDQDGYLLSKLRNKDKVVTMKIHRAVAIAFIENPLKKPFVNHKDGNKQNNCVSNLEWVTAQENSDHAKKLGLLKCPNRQKVQQLKNGIVIDTFNSLKEAQEKTGIGWTGISGVIRGTRNTAGGFQWRKCND